MVWLMIAIASIILGFVLANKTAGNSFGFLFLTIPLIVVLSLGMSVYPTLIGEREEVLSLQSEIESIREAHYSEVKSGDLVGGSLDNLKQSSILSEYIRSYARNKARFNRRLKEAQTRTHLLSHIAFADAIFIDERVRDIEPIR